jgi:hypothetical protein
VKRKLGEEGYDGDCRGLEGTMSRGFVPCVARKRFRATY